MKYINNERKINVIKGKRPIVFAHKNYRDVKENHHLHINDHVEIYIYINGDIGYIVENSYYDLKLGDIIAVNPHEAHSVVIKKPCEYERFYILIPTDTFDMLTSDPLYGVLNRPKGASALISLPDKERKLFCNTLYKISELTEKDIGAKETAECFAHILDLLSVINNNSNTNTENAKEIKGISDIIKSVLDNIDKNLSAKVSIGDIARECGVTPQYLSFAFKKQIGITLNTYIRTRRIALAN